MISEMRRALLGIDDPVGMVGDSQDEQNAKAFVDADFEMEGGAFLTSAELNRALGLYNRLVAPTIQVKHKRSVAKVLISLGVARDLRRVYGKASRGWVGIRIKASAEG